MLAIRGATIKLKFTPKDIVYGLLPLFLLAVFLLLLFVYGEQVISFIYDLSGYIERLIP